MGLDAWAYTVPEKFLLTSNEIDVNLDDTVEESSQTPLSEREQMPIKQEIWYWRKFHELHSWMENLYGSKGGNSEFNCKTVRLMPEDLDNLEKFVLCGGLNLDDENDVLLFVTKARENINNKFAVFYDSWW